MISFYKLVALCILLEYFKLINLHNVFVILETQGQKYLIEITWQEKFILANGLIKS